MSSSIADLIANPVAPLAGAWIEIYYPTTVITADGVAPLAGAWIEITHILYSHITILVAPLAGAWIEITQFFSLQWLLHRRSPRGSVD